MISLKNPFVSFLDDDNKENQANGKLESPVKWSTQNGSDSGTYAEIGGNSHTSERNILDPADSSEEEVPLPDATSPGRSSDGPEPRADITATLEGGKKKINITMQLFMYFYFRFLNTIFTASTHSLLLNIFEVIFVILSLDGKHCNPGCFGPPKFA